MKWEYVVEGLFERAKLGISHLFYSFGRGWLTRHYYSEQSMSAFSYVLVTYVGILVRVLVLGKTKGSNIYN